MNLKTRLENKENKWIRVHFMDSTYFTGVLRHIGADFLELECYGRDETPHGEGSGSYTQHLIPLSLIKFITVEANSFLDAERKRLEYIARNTRWSENCDLPEIER